MISIQGSGLRCAGLMRVASVLLTGTMLSACGASGAVTPGSSKITIHGCGGPVLNSAERQVRCSGGGLAFVGVDAGYNAYSARTAALQYAAQATTSDGTVAADGTGTASSDPNDGTVNVAVNDSTNGLQYNVAFIQAHFIGEGTTVANGVTLYKDSVNGIATGDFTDHNGVAWHAVGTPDADGVNTTVTLTSSAGAGGTVKFSNNSLSPSLAAQAVARAPQSTRHTLGVAAKIAVAAAAVSSVMFSVAAASAMTGNVPVAVAAAAVGAGAAVVAAAAAAADADEKDKTGKKC